MPLSYGSTLPHLPYCITYDPPLPRGSQTRHFFRVFSSRVPSHIYRSSLVYADTWLYFTHDISSHTTKWVTTDPHSPHRTPLCTLAWCCSTAFVHYFRARTPRILQSTLKWVNIECPIRTYSYSPSLRARIVPPAIYPSISPQRSNNKVTHMNISTHD